MKKRKPVKPMFSLQKRFGDGGRFDPTIRAWREIQRAQPDLPLAQRLVTLALDGMPVNEEDPDGLPDGIEVRVEELREYLLAAGEIAPEEMSHSAHLEHLKGALDDVAPFADRLRRLLHLDDEKVELIPTRAAAEPVAEELLRESWTLVNRKFPGSLWERIVYSVALLYRSFVGGSTENDPDLNEALMDALHQAFCTWLFKNGAEMLTPAEADEMRSFQAPPPA